MTEEKTLFGPMNKIVNALELEITLVKIDLKGVAKGRKRLDSTEFLLNERLNRLQSAKREAVKRSEQDQDSETAAEIAKAEGSATYKAKKGIGPVQKLEKDAADPLKMPDPPKKPRKARKPKVAAVPMAAPKAAGGIDEIF